MNKFWDRPLFGFVLLLFQAQTLCAQGILYFDGPSFYLSGSTSTLDLNGDGASDFVFSGQFLTEGGAIYFECSILGVGANQMLITAGSDAFFQTTGFVVGPSPNSPSVWGNPSISGAGITSTFEGSGVWSDYLGQLDDGYLGLRVSEPDGWHYGWVQLNLPTTSFGTPTVLDWAYEISPDTPIALGETPEPSTLPLIVIGMVFFAVWHWRKTES